MDPFKLTRLDYKIQNISMFGSDESISPLNAYNFIELKKDGEVDYNKIDGLLKQNKEFSEITLEDEIKEGEKSEIWCSDWKSSVSKNY